MMDALKATRERSPQLFAEAVQWLSSDCLIIPGSSCSVFGQNSTSTFAKGGRWPAQLHGRSQG